jgi:hypothetical protein
LVQHTKTGANIPNNHKIYQSATKHTKWQQNIPNVRKVCRPKGHKIHPYLPLQGPPKFTSKFYPNWYFWFENVPSGSPALNSAEGKMTLKAF